MASKLTSNKQGNRFGLLTWGLGAPAGLDPATYGVEVDPQAVQVDSRGGVIAAQVGRVVHTWGS
jgi:hypothetical protein